MPSIADRARRLGLTPLEQSAELVRVINSGKAVDPLPTPVALDNLGDEDLVYELEKRRAHIAASNFDTWLRAYAAWLGVPDDKATQDFLDIIPTALEAELMAKVTWPEIYEDRNDEEEIGLWTVADAVAAGLTIRPLRKNRQRKNKRRCHQPTLPGCGGGFLTSPTHVCTNLRIRGHEFCPSCEQVIGT